MSPAVRTLACLSLLVMGCKEAQPLRAPDGEQVPEGDGAERVGDGADDGSGARAEPGSGAEPEPQPESGTGSGSGSDAGAGAGGNAVPIPGPEKRGPPLPELRVKSFGLHVGGTARDAAAREDFLKALKRNSWRYLECYQLIEQPGSEGTFGADLHVGAQGGKPSVSGVRTKLKGAEFRSCMERALESTKFETTPSGRSVVVSYSLKFSFAW